MMTLKERINHYERDISDTRLLDKLPVVIIVNGRSFRKATSLLPKPFSFPFAEIMASVMVKLLQDVDGAVFAYSFSDEIVIVSRNDQSLDTTPWYENRIQKIVSASASIATLELYRAAEKTGVELLGDPVFTANTFVVPSISEAANLLVSKQQQAYHTNLYLAAFYELLAKYNVDIARKALVNKTYQEKLVILAEQCGIEFENYPNAFKRGFACYRIPKLVVSGGIEEIRNKITLDMDLPIFSRDKEFLDGVFR